MGATSQRRLQRVYNHKWTPRGVHNNTRHNGQAVKTDKANAALDVRTERQSWVTIARLPQGGWSTTNPIRVSLAWLQYIISGYGRRWLLSRAIVAQGRTRLVPGQLSSKPSACTFHGGRQALASSEVDHVPGTYILLCTECVFVHINTWSISLKLKSRQCRIDESSVCASFGLTVSEAKTEAMCLMTKRMDRVTFVTEAAG